jgi:heme o synthase
MSSRCAGLNHPREVRRYNNMESFAGQAVIADRASLTLSEKLSAYAELTKPRITFLVVLTAAAGFCMGSASGIDYARLLNTSIGIALLSSGLATLNQYFERDLDRLMRRTQARPLPTGKLLPAEAALFGILLSIVATAYLAILINPLSALLGIATFASYLFVYTPLKTRTTLSTVLGAFPGAMPPLIGWVAASGGITVEAWILFAILFLWQFPHFLAIAWMYRDDYARAGIKMLPVVEPDGRVTGQQIITYTLLLVPVSLLPSVTGLAGSVYLVSAALLGVGFLYFSARAALARTTWQARRLLLASVIYLPILFGMMVLNR